MKKDRIERKWTTSSIPPQDGRSVVITGTGGLGYETALALAAAGADVTLAGRNPEKGMQSVQKILAAHRTANIRFEKLDLASLDSISEFGYRIKDKHGSLDLLINNAGISSPPKRQETSDGFEMQLGTNYLGHFALTAELLPLLLRGLSPRIVNVCSLAAKDGSINFEDINAQRSYRPMAGYSQSKLANLMFSLELQRRSESEGWGIASIAAHPGVSRTDLIPNGAGQLSLFGLLRVVLWFMFQSPAQGALPTLFAASSPEAEGGAYYGPDKLGETRGHPAEASIPTQAQDKLAASRLWKLSEAMTGASFR